MSKYHFENEHEDADVMAVVKRHAGARKACLTSTKTSLTYLNA